MWYNKYIVSKVSDTIAHDKAVKEAKTIAKNFRVLTYDEAYAILEKKSGEIEDRELGKEAAGDA